ncbi:uncharacterized protein A1O9_05239 [Exophiala aquamarina CBS 119918]|uniref:Calcineurin-like phosphoesterase domain-containing protein n=1 Tax=Exophiala aquamarina CBS 119918 TaxID=1182545 RepID=A0A072PC52_9EURO|nr:uncharacterized protein A1O9_05239 [Exophiala aquamarina CBS 119918]KEF57322.1 hypothetical protein A1O9_05239 [Exophiala aquamarina CBS 119918]
MAASNSSIGLKTRLLILSDTHSALPRHSDSAFDSAVPFQTPLPAADVLIHCGDLTSNGRLDQHHKALELINSVDSELKIVIPGNHDLTLDRSYYDRYPNAHCHWQKYSDDVLREIKELYTGAKARQSGIRYLEEGMASFKLKSGASLNVYASAWQPEFCNWAFGYSREEDRFNPLPDGCGPESPVPDSDIAGGRGGVDIMVTHGPPKGFLDRTVGGDYVGCDHLRRAVRRCRPLIHCFGHIHEGWGAMSKDWDLDDAEGGASSTTTANSTPSTFEPPIKQRSVYVDATGLEPGKETLFINASIMTVRYRPLNAPWLVDIELPMG